MYVETITFDRVFDVQRRLPSRLVPKRTDFSFESAGKRRFAVQVQGWPRIQAGDTITAVLEKEGNWQTLAGWKNHMSGEVVLPAVARSFAGIWRSAFVGTVCLFNFTVIEAPILRVANGCASAIGFIMVAVLFLRWRRQKLLVAAIQRAA